MPTWLFLYTVFFHIRGQASWAALPVESTTQKVFTVSTGFSFQFTLASGPRPPIFSVFSRLVPHNQLLISSGRCRRDSTSFSLLIIKKGLFGYHFNHFMDIPHLWSESITSFSRQWVPAQIWQLSWLCCWCGRCWPCNRHRCTGAAAQPPRWQGLGGMTLCGPSWSCPWWSWYACNDMKYDIPLTTWLLYDTMLLSPAHKVLLNWKQNNNLELKYRLVP